ncbi:MAG: hypothetical protein L0220_00505 [Acidobacteria bacterium]|nr:hypothetical protein [Acidobacteriota bacterium]
MKCSEFEKIVSDLAHGRVNDKEDEAERERARHHATSCHECAARLADEQRLSAGLKALARVEEDRNVPQRVETALLASFRQNALKETASSLNFYRVRMPRWAWAAAVAVLLALGLIAAGTFWQETGQTGNDRKIVETPASAPAREIVDQPDKQPGVANNYKVKQIRKLKRANNVMAQKKPVDPISDRVMIKEEMTLYVGEQEITTDFMPVFFSADTQPMERGQLIRVQMPRSAMLKFGLPMNFERANVPVKADLLIGEDGLAQAIRFVR